MALWDWLSRGGIITNPGALTHPACYHCKAVARKRDKVSRKWHWICRYCRCLGYNPVPPGPRPEPPPAPPPKATSSGNDQVKFVTHEQLNDVLKQLLASMEALSDRLVSWLALAEGRNRNAVTGHG